jgi:hypothetical protein
MPIKPDVLHRYRVQHADDPSVIHEDQARQFEAYRRAVAKGNITALLAALELCTDRRRIAFGEALQSVPNWLLIETLKTLRPAVVNGSLGQRGKGRHARWSAKATDDQADLLRAHEVLIARERGVRGDRAFEKASKELEGTFAYASAKNVEKAFKRFQKRRKTEPERYFGTSIHLPEEDS